jgi:hypothetical protein
MYIVHYIYRCMDMYICISICVCIYSTCISLDVNRKIEIWRYTDRNREREREIGRLEEAGRQIDSVKVWRERESERETEGKKRRDQP